MKSKQGKRRKTRIGNIKERLSSWTRKPVFCVAGFIALVMTIIAAIHIFFKNGKIDEISDETGAALIVAIPTTALFLAARAQLRKHRESQRMAFLGEYVSKIFTDRELSDTFHYLVYTYDDDEFCKVKLRLKTKNITEKAGQQKMYRCLKSMQDGRKVGFRLYHPAMFKDSVEEKRLDSLLGYFNIIAYYKKKKLLSMDDINGSVGYHLTVMGARKVIKKYMKVIDEDWKRGKHGRKFGQKHPFHYLNKFLKKLMKKRGVRHK